MTAKTIISNEDPTRSRPQELLFVVNVDWFFVSHRLPIAIEAMRQGFEVHIAKGITARPEALAALGLAVHPLPLARSGVSVVGEFWAFRRMLSVVRSVRPRCSETRT